jgi:hypothetical protein
MAESDVKLTDLQKRLNADNVNIAVTETHDFSKDVNLTVKLDPLKDSVAVGINLKF